jgi:hypothetical protein
MMSRFRPILAPMLAACLGATALLGGCADPNDRNQRALAGGALGAGAGAIIGSFTGSAGKGALLGGAIGAVGGALTPAPEPERVPSYPAHGYDPRQGGYYDQHGQWIPAQAPEGYVYRPNYR